LLILVLEARDNRSCHADNSDNREIRIARLERIRGALAPQGGGAGEGPASNLNESHSYVKAAEAKTLQRGREPYDEAILNRKMTQ